MGPRPVALVFRGASTEQDDDLAEPIAHLLRTSPYHFKVRIVGPDEDEDLDEDSLGDADLFAMPGGPDLDTAYKELKGAKKALQKFVSSGGRYFGTCLGGYLAGENPGLSLLPKGADTDSECTQKNAEVTTDDDAVIDVDWTYCQGPYAGQTHKNQTVYYQEGPCMLNFPETDSSFIVARYSQSGRAAVTLNSYGSGWVACVGPHMEADESWYEEAEIDMPRNGVRFDLGYDIIGALMEGGVAPRSQGGSQAPPRAHSSHQHRPDEDEQRSGGLGRLFDKVRDIIDN